MGLNLDASPEELKLFIEEVEEHFQLLEEDLVRLEKQENTEELLQEIFRAAHTLKGSSATIGHNRMAELTHAMENVLDKLRKNILSIRSDIIDILFEGLDLLRVLKDEIINDEESDIDLSTVIHKLANVSEDGVVKPPESVTQPPVMSCEVAEEEKLEIGLAEKDKIAAGQKEGQRPALVHVQYEAHGEMLPVRFFITMMSLRELGEVLKSDPTDEQIENEQVSTSLKVILLTDQNDEVIIDTLSKLPDIVSVLSSDYSADNFSEAAPEVAEVIKPVVENIVTEEKKAAPSKTTTNIRLEASPALAIPLVKLSTILLPGAAI